MADAGTIRGRFSWAAERGTTSAQVAALRLHPVHGGPWQRRSIAPLSEAVAGGACTSCVHEDTEEEVIPVFINGSFLEIDARGMGSFRVPLLLSELRCVDQGNIVEVKCHATPTSSTNCLSSRQAPMEVVDCGNETYVCFTCLSRNLRGFRCPMVDSSVTSQSQTQCPQCAAKDSELDIWVFQVMPDDERLAVNEALEVALAALAQGGAMRTDLVASFEIGEEIGSGSNAAVHFACPKRRQVLNEAEEGIVAKFFYPELGPEGDVPFATIAQEVLVLAALQHHPNIVGFRGFFCTNPRDSFRWPSSAKYALMMDFCGCGNLLQHSQDGFLSEEKAAYVMHELLSALSHMHSHGFVHRDVKLENIMWSSNGRVVLTDFGLCCRMLDAEEMKRRCGTPGYIAPEMLGKKVYDAKVDIFAAGVVLYATLFLDMPFAGRDLVTLFRRTVRCQPNYKVPPEREALSRKCLHFVALLLRRSAADRPDAEEALTRSWLRRRKNFATLDQSALQPTSTLDATPELVDMNQDASIPGGDSLSNLESASGPLPTTRPPSAHFSPALQQPSTPEQSDMVSLAVSGWEAAEEFAESDALEAAPVQAASGAPLSGKALSQQKDAYLAEQKPPIILCYSPLKRRLSPHQDVALTGPSQNYVRAIGAKEGAQTDLEERGNREEAWTDLTPSDSRNIEPTPPSQPRGTRQSWPRKLVQSLSETDHAAHDARLIAA